MFGDKPLTYTFVAGNGINYGTVVQQSGTTGREVLGWQATSINQTLAGIAMAEISSGDQVGVCILGIARAVAGASVTAGARVTVNSVGRVVAATSGQAFIGKAMTSAGANGDTFEVFVNAVGDSILG